MVLMPAAIPIGAHGKITYTKIKETPPTWRARTKYRDADNALREIERFGPTKVRAQAKMTEALDDLTGPEMAEAVAAWHRTERAPLTEMQTMLQDLSVTIAPLVRATTRNTLEPLAPYAAAIAHGLEEGRLDRTEVAHFMAQFFQVLDWADEAPSFYRGDPPADLAERLAKIPPPGQVDPQH